MKTKTKKYIFLTACLTLLLCFNNIAYTEAESSEVRTLWLNKDAKGAIAKAGSAQIPGKPQILRKSKEEALFTSSATYATATFCEMERGTYDRLRLPGGGHGGEVGKPEIPYYGQFIAVPKNADVKLIIDTATIRPIEGVYRVTPVQPPLPDTEDAESPPFTINRRAYAQNRYLGEDNVVRIADDVILRGKRLLYIIYQPVLYNPRASKLKAAQDVTWHLEYTYTKATSPAKTWEKELNDSVGNMVIDAVPGDKVTADQVGQGVSLNTDGADYLIITHDNFYDEIVPLAEWKKKKGYQVKVTKLSEIGSDPTSDDIRAYIIDAYNTWTPRPLYLLLVGDSGFLAPCYKDNQGNSISSASDLYYGAVDGSDYFPDIFVGRLPAATTQECECIVNKILLMENNPPALASYYTTALMAGYFQDLTVDDPFDNYEGRIFVETCEGVKDFLEHEGWTVKTSYATDTPSFWLHYNRTSNGSILHHNGDEYVGTQIYLGTANATEAVTSAINDGVWLVQHRNHGDETSWEHPRYRISNIQALTNNDMPTFVNSINCDTGTYDRSGGDCFAEAFLKKPTGGAYAIIAASRTSYSWWNDYLVHGFYECMFPDYFETLSTFTGYRRDLSYSGNYVGNGTHFGQMLNFGKMFMYDKRASGTVTKKEFQMFHLFGCPEQEPRMVVPQTLTISHPVNIPANQPASFDVTVEVGGLPLEGARVSLISDLEFYAGVTNTQGVVHFSFTPEDTDGIDITVTHRDARPYEGQINVLTTPRTLTVINGTGDGTYYFGEVVDIVADPPSPNYRFDRWTGDTATVVDIDDPSITLTMPDSDVTITAQYRLGAYTLNAVAGPGGSGIIKNPDESGYAYGEVVELTAEALPTYHFTHWTGEFPAGHQLDNPLDITIEEDIDITANFSRDTYIILANAHGCGAINPSGQVPVTHGTNKTFTMTPNVGCHVTDVVADTVSRGPITTYTFPNITSSHTIDAYFAINTYELTVNGGSGTDTYEHGTVVSIAAYPPQAGYHFTHWSGDIANVANPNASSTTITMLGNATITANYAINVYTISPSSGPHGNINPSVAVQVNHGSNQTFDMIPNQGYLVADVLVDGSSIGAPTSHTFTNVTSDHTIHATFDVDPFSLESHNIIDDWTGMSIKVNGDTKFNPGEQIDLQIELKNTGTQTVNNVSATISTSDPEIRIVENTVSFCASMTPGQSCVSLDNFTIEAFDTITPPYTVSFDLDITADGGHQSNEQLQITIVRPFAEGPPSDAVRIDRGDVPGANDSFGSKIATDGEGNVYVVFIDKRNGAYDIYFNRSHDYGTTWLSTEIRLDTDLAGSSDSFNPSLGCDDTGNVYVVWRDRRNGGIGYEDIYFNYSRDYGVTWQTNDIKLNTDAQASGYVSMACDVNSNVYVMWSDNRSGDYWYIYFNYSNDGGATWQNSDMQFTTNASGNYSLAEGDISCDNNGNVYVIWCEKHSSVYDIYFNCSHDYGATWLAQGVTLDRNPSSRAWNSAISSDDNGYVYAVWCDDRNVEWQVYFNYSDDHGVTWQASDIRISDTIAEAMTSWFPSLASDNNGNVYVTWGDKRGTYYDLYFDSSDDHGVTWSTDRKINSGLVGKYSTYLHRLYCNDGGGVYAVWGCRDNIIQRVHPYLNYSLDHGATWLDESIKLDAGIGANPHIMYSPRVDCDDGGNTFIVWSDYCNGLRDVYLRSMTIPRDFPEVYEITDYAVNVGNLLEFGVTGKDAERNELELFYSLNALLEQQKINMSNAAISQVSYDPGTGENTSLFDWTPDPGTSDVYDLIYFVARNPQTGRCGFKDMGITVTETGYTLNTIAQNGSIAKLPDKATYDPGDIVQLTAEPNAGWSFVDWSGNLSGNQNPENITMDANKIVIANFKTANNAPKLLPIGNKEGIEGQQFIIKTMRATDVDGDTLTIDATNLPSGARFFQTGSGEIAPGHTFVDYKLRWPTRFVKEGVYTVTFTASDGELTDSETITITIHDAGNRAPVLRNIGDREGPEKQWFVIKKIIATDLDGDNLTMSIINRPLGAKFIKVEDRPGYIEYKLKWPPKFVKQGVYENITFTVRDEDGEEASETITITVNDTGNLDPMLRRIGDRRGAAGKWFVIRRIIGVDDDGDGLTMTADNLPPGARFNQEESRPGFIEYKLKWPDKYVETGVYENVTFTVRDPHGREDSETITITITK